MSPDVGVAGVAEVMAEVVGGDALLRVSDPATKQKLQLPFRLTDATNGRALYFANLYRQDRRESHLCMLFQKGKCRSGARCNQVHADRDHIARIRQVFFSANGRTKEDADEPLTHQRSLEVVVSDPYNRASKIVIPFSKTKDTLGRRAFLALSRTAKPAAPLPNYDLCATFSLSGACAMGAACPQIHGSREFVRYLQEGDKPCCPYHGHSDALLNGYRNNIFMINKLGLRCPTPVNRLGITRGLTELVNPSAPLVFPCNRVCRLHQEKRCLFNEGCANLHVCREFYALFCNVTDPSAVALPDPYATPTTGTTTGTSSTNSSVVGVPVAGEAKQNQGLGVPLITEEGALPLWLLPTHVQGLPSVQRCLQSAQAASHKSGGGKATDTVPGDVPYATSEPADSPPQSPEVERHYSTDPNPPQLVEALSSQNIPPSAAPLQYASPVRAPSTTPLPAALPLPPPAQAIPRTWSEVERNAKAGTSLACGIDLQRQLGAFSSCFPWGLPRADSTSKGASQETDADFFTKREISLPPASVR
eukprot:Hpha_TRINITY_DN16143_c5_g1::TRINITY_DN16143_c5_g1_i1::g.6926::m.6926